ncbi:hypothetical protein LGV59_21110 [Bacteroides fragilis]|nr:hypothetical protein [Bacteroides fragilis]
MLSGALVGTSYEHYKYERLAGSREEFPSDALTDTEAGSTSEGYTNGAGSSEYKMLSYFARVNYTLMDRYLFEVTICVVQNASSRFIKRSSLGIFPSFSAGWSTSAKKAHERYWSGSITENQSLLWYTWYYKQCNYDYFKIIGKSL